jgi:hypothetical protein
MKLKALSAVFAAFLVFLAHHASASSVIFVGIDSSGPMPRYDVNRVSKTLPELRAWLAAVIETFGSADPVVIDPDDATSGATLVTVFDTVQAAGVRSVTLRSTADFDFGFRYWRFELPECLKAPRKYDARITTDADITR